MSNLSEAQYLLDNLDHSIDGNHLLIRVTEAQARATVAVAEAQTLANLIAFLNWSMGQDGPKIPDEEYNELRTEVREKIKELLA